MLLEVQMLPVGSGLASIGPSAPNRVPTLVDITWGHWAGKHQALMHPKAQNHHSPHCTMPWDPTYKDHIVNSTSCGCIYIGLLEDQSSWILCLMSIPSSSRTLWTPHSVSVWKDFRLGGGEVKERKHLFLCNVNTELAFCVSLL